MYHGVCRCAMDRYSPFRAEYGRLIGCTKLSFSCYKPRKETETQRRGMPNCLGKACSVSEEHFPRREKLARFPRNISPGGKTLLGFRGTLSRAGKACSVSEGHFPGRENLARFPRNISPGGKSLLGFRGTLSQAGKPCSVSEEHFPRRENLAWLVGNTS